MALELIDINKRFSIRDSDHEVNVIDNIRYVVDCGKFVSIVGPSGCGKTTLLRIIAGLETASSGTVLLNGIQLIPGSDAVGFVFQEYALFPWRTMMENIEIGLEIKKIDKKTRQDLVMEYIESFNLKGFENRYPKEMSGGMKQRVAIARTLIMKPKVILMDEPFGALDCQTRNDLQQFLLRVWKNMGGTILFVTHNVDEAVFMSDQIIVLSKRPAQIVKVFNVDVVRPRDRTSGKCNQIRKDILNLIV